MTTYAKLLRAAATLKRVRAGLDSLAAAARDEEERERLRRAAAQARVMEQGLERRIQRVRAEEPQYARQSPPAGNGHASAQGDGAGQGHATRTGAPADEPARPRTGAGEAAGRGDGQEAGPDEDRGAGRERGLVGPASGTAARPRGEGGRVEPGAPEGTTQAR